PRGEAAQPRGPMGPQVGSPVDSPEGHRGMRGAVSVNLPPDALAIEPATSPPPTDNLPRCGRWKLKPFELPRPVLLRPDGPLSLHDFLLHPDPTVLTAFRQLDP